MGTYLVREDGRNAEVEVRADRIVRTRVDANGHEDVETIPIETVNAVSLDRKKLATDNVTLQVGLVSYRWRVKRAEEMQAEVHRIRFVTPR